MLDLIRPEWPVPAHVYALTTTRVGGVSAVPFDSLNLGDHVDDDPAAVSINRKLLLDSCAGLNAISWLQQVHGTEIVKADARYTQRADTHLTPSADAHLAPSADAQYTRATGIACAIMTADCLPVLFCDRAGTQIAAAHAGWRGLCAGVLEATVSKFGDPAQVLAWLGPAIGPSNFEVGAEVREQFLAATPALAPQIEKCFVASAPFTEHFPFSKNKSVSKNKSAQHFLADIYALARLRLRAVGVTAVYGGGLCTVADRQRFYSYRRDGRCGRMATLIYLVTDS